MDVRQVINKLVAQLDRAGDPGTREALILAIGELSDQAGQIKAYRAMLKLPPEAHVGEDVTIDLNNPMGFEQAIMAVRRGDITPTFSGGPTDAVSRTRVPPAQTGPRTTISEVAGFTSETWMGLT